MSAPADGPSPTDDVLAVIDTLHAFAQGIDRRDWALYRSVFADEIDLDYSSYRPTNVGHWRADDWVARAQRLFPGLDASAHTLTNHRVVVDGDRATIMAYVKADHVVIEDGTSRVYTICGYYDDDLVRTGGAWRIVRKCLVVRWTDGDRTVMDVAAARAASAG